MIILGEQTHLIELIVQISIELPDV